MQIISQHLRKLVNIVCPENQIDLGIFFFYFFNDLRLLHHTAAHCQHKIGIYFFNGFKGAQISKHAHIRVFTHTAGVQDNDSCLMDIFLGRITHIFQQARNLFRIIFVHLAAKSHYFICLIH
ncbi:hypothetical protein SDC9_174964 [bioreactor metagenome]|uniref:Uncharacterized protein n=1 Tax=bioreactor metagenome TaxID=1076179 RepID=A0A645GMX5_9ZZZZ